MSLRSKPRKWPTDAEGDWVPSAEAEEQVAEEAEQQSPVRFGAGIERFSRALAASPAGRPPPGSPPRLPQPRPSPPRLREPGDDPLDADRTAAEE